MGKTNISRVSHLALVHLHIFRGGEEFISMPVGNYVGNHECV